MRQTKKTGGFELKRKPGRAGISTTKAPLPAPTETALPAILAVPPAAPAPVAKPRRPRATPAAVTAPVAAAPVVAAPPVVATPAPVAVAPPAPPPEAPVAAPPVSPVQTNQAEEEKTMATVADTFTNTDAAAKMQGFVADAQGKAKSAMEKGSKFYEEMGDFTKGNVEAMIASTKVAATAAESMGHDAVAYGKQSVEELTALFRSFASVKSPTEMFQLQSDYARKAFDAAVAEGSKVSEKLVKVTGEIVQPISTRMSLAAEKVKGAASL